MEHLSKLGIGGKGTIHLNKTEKAPLIEPQAKKKSQKLPSLKSLTKHRVKV